MHIPRHWRLLLLAGLFVAFAAAMLFEAPLLRDLASRLDADSVAALVERAGLLGPLLLIGLMTAAIVFSPIPSAPIAMAAGAAYGHVWGTLYTLIGAEAGALIAFGLARVLGRDALRHWLGDDRLSRGLMGSQNWLTLLVFASRLMPFISFDMISYAAGLSALSFWRFAVATLAGILPASFLLAHIGDEAMNSRLGGSLWLILGLGLVTGLPAIIAATRKSPQDPPPKDDTPRNGPG